MQFIKNLITVSTEIFIECNVAIYRAEQYALRQTRKTVRNVVDKMKNKKKFDIKDTKRKPLLSEHQEVSV